MRFIKNTFWSRPHQLAVAPLSLIVGAEPVREFTMFRPAMRAAPRAARLTLSSTRAGGSRFVSTQPPHLRSRSWKSSALRWGIAVAGIYYYNTSPVFAEQPHHSKPRQIYVVCSC